MSALALAAAVLAAASVGSLTVLLAEDWRDRSARLGSGLTELGAQVAADREQRGA